MGPVTHQPGFVAAVARLPSVRSQFAPGFPSTGRCLPFPLARRGQRARIFALGAAPPPSEPEKENDEDVEAETPDPDALEEVTADDILSSPAFLKKKLEIVQKELIDAKKSLESDSEGVQTEKERYLRLAADFENYRRRSMEDLRKQDRKSTAKVCKSILGVLDSFERATAAVNAQTDRERSISESYQSINKQLVEALGKLDVVALEAVGQPFDPEVHEAIQKMESTEYGEDIVCAQFQRGYMIGETLIRAAIVGVSSGPGPEAEETVDTEAAAASVGEGSGADANDASN